MATVYRNLGEIVNPAHTALIIWDVQNSLVNRIFNKAEFTQNIKSLIQAARTSNVPLVYTKTTPLPRQYESPWRTYMQMKRSGVDDPAKLPPATLPGSPDSEIYSEVNPQGSDMVFTKHTADIFIGTHFEYLMRNRGIETLLFAGISTEMGIASSARDSGNRSFYTIVVQDCVSSSDKEMHELALRILDRVCLVVPAGDIVRGWKR